MFKKLLGFSLFTILILAGFDALAGGTAHWGGFPEPKGPIAQEVTDIYNIVYYITAVIAVLVLGGLLYCVWKFRASKNPKAATFSHSTVLEVVWTIIPAIICIYIAVISYKGIDYIRTMPEKGLTVEVIAYQFGWDFDYPDLEVSSSEAEAPHAQLSSAPGVERYVKDMVVPVDTVVKMHVTAKDVIHAFYAPDLGVKIDAIPGRINYQWFEASEVGDYIGQCAELWGAAHGEMYFNVKAVSKEDFKAWVNSQRRENGLAKLAAKDFESALQLIHRPFRWLL